MGLRATGAFSWDCPFHSFHKLLTIDVNSGLRYYFNHDYFLQMQRNGKDFQRQVLFEIAAIDTTSCRSQVGLPGRSRYP